MGKRDTPSGTTKDDPEPGTMYRVHVIETVMRGVDIYVAADSPQDARDKVFDPEEETTEDRSALDEETMSQAIYSVTEA